MTGWGLTLAALASFFAAILLQEVSDIHRVVFLVGLMILELGVVYYSAHYLLAWLARAER